MTPYKQITREEAINLFIRIGDACNVSAEVFTANFQYEETAVLNNGVVFINGQGSTFLNNETHTGRERNAIEALKQIEKIGNKFKVYSSYFNWANGDYSLIF
jgi:hypothetical protein